MLLLMLIHWHWIRLAVAKWDILIIIIGHHHNVLGLLLNVKRLLHMLEDPAHLED